MTPIDPSELSAYLDDELDAARVAEVEAALPADAGLVAELAALEAADAKWRKAARAAQFEPCVPLPVGRSFADSPWRLAAIVIALLGLRFVPGLVAWAAWSFGVEALALAILAAWIVRAAGRSATGVDSRRE